MDTETKDVPAMAEDSNHTHHNLQSEREPGVRSGVATEFLQVQSYRERPEPRPSSAPWGWSAGDVELLSQDASRPVRLGQSLFPFGAVFIFVCYFVSAVSRS